MRIPFALLGSTISAGLLLPLAAQTTPSPVTFSANIAPIIYQRCAACHRPGEAAPFSLLTYEDVHKRGAQIAAVTASRLMPPWRAEPASYEYKDSRRLSQTEIATIQAWVKQGMPEGDPAKTPALPKFTEGWQLGPPDLIVKMDKSFTVPAEGPDIYRYLRIPLNLPDDKWVRAIELRPSARRVVHHVLFFADSAEEAKRIESAEDSGQTQGSAMRLTRTMVPLGGGALGALPHMLPDGLAQLLPKGTDLMFQYHFHPTGKEETEQSTVGLYFAKRAPTHTLTYIQLPVAYGLFAGVDIPPGDKHFSVRESYTLPVDVQAISVGAHAHYLGKAMKMTATFPDGAVKTLLDIENWNFAWQDRYFFNQSLLLPKGTILESEVIWDNSADNVSNPASPPVEVRWGEQTKDEMGAVSLQVYPARESDLATLERDYVAHRKAVARARIMKDPSMMTRLREVINGQAQQ